MPRSDFAGYLSLLLLIPPGLHAATSQAGRWKDVSETTLSQFVERLKREGRPTQVLPYLIKVGNFPADSTKKTFSVYEPDTTDGVVRIVDIVFSSSVPIALSWDTRRVANGRSDNYIYRTGLDGALERAVRGEGKTDESGRDIRGAGKATVLDVHSKEVRERFRREVLDFWLKGIGRKKPVSSPQQ